MKDSAYILGGCKAGTSLASIEKLNYMTTTWSMVKVSLRQARHQYRATLVPIIWLGKMEVATSKGKDSIQLVMAANEAGVKLLI